MMKEFSFLGKLFNPFNPHKFEYFAVLFMLSLLARMIPQSLYNPGFQLP